MLNFSRISSEVQKQVRRLSPKKESFQNEIILATTDTSTCVNIKVTSTDTCGVDYERIVQRNRQLAKNISKQATTLKSHSAKISSIKLQNDNLKAEQSKTKKKGKVELARMDNLITEILELKKKIKQDEMATVNMKLRHDNLEKNNRELENKYTAELTQNESMQHQIKNLTDSLSSMEKKNKNLTEELDMAKDIYKTEKKVLMTFSYHNK
ncbi:unnamed protein product [Mytilus edulis]|uniref:Uncharacterized protein n=1 Tax=Mytilus edulis TaxID=6550 RepID=A0A8S3SNP8_MYTED|nr:unnamed protein product [Mytilus edulis]